MPLDFTLTPEQEEIKALAHEFAEKEIRPVAPHYDETEEFPWPVLKKAHEVGLTPVAVMPEVYGGGGLDVISNMLIAEELDVAFARVRFPRQQLSHRRESLSQTGPVGRDLQSCR